MSQKYISDSRITFSFPFKNVWLQSVSSHTRSPSAQMDTRAEKCVFIGPTPNKRGYKCFNPRTRKIQISMDVSFLENQPYFAQNCLQGEREIRTSFLGNICTFTRFSNQYSRNNLIYLCRVIDYHKYGGEIFPTCESLVYTMKGFHHTRKDQPKIPIQVQSSSPSTDPQIFQTILQFLFLPQLYSQILNFLILIFPQHVGKESDHVPGTLLLIFVISYSPITINYL